jgi:L-ribulokinase
MGRYALGLDYGTNSARAVIVDLSDGRELSGSVADYPSGEAGILLDPADPNCARQNPRDYVDVLAPLVTRAVAQARDAKPEFDPNEIIGIGVDTTGSTPIPVDESGTPLAMDDEFRNDLNAMGWLWKDHTSHAEAARITEIAREMRPQYLAKCGGVYSSEWFWAKALHLAKVAPNVFEAMHSFVECCDYLPALLSGDTRPDHIARGICAAGHKAMYSDSWGGLPDRDFLAAVDPALADLPGRLYEKAQTSDRVAGRLSAQWAEKLGLKPGIAVAVGAIDAHMGAVGAGIREGTLVKILGTSTCDMMVQPDSAPLADIPGVSGIVEGSILPGHFGIEAGQSAVGDIFLWWVSRAVPERYGATQDEKFQRLMELASKQRPGEHGLLALDWNNGNRNILADPRLSGLLVGQSLHTEPHEIYRALIEATAFGALRIIERIEQYGVLVKEVVNCGGLAVKNPLLMQIYADVLDRPMKISRSDQACALGAAIFGAVAAGKEASGFSNAGEAQKAMCGARDTVYAPDPANRDVYSRLYALYGDLHDAFGTKEWTGNLRHVMKSLIEIREALRRS